MTSTDEVVAITHEKSLELAAWHNYRLPSLVSRLTFHVSRFTFAKITSQALLISRSLMVSGGAIRRQSGAKRNQSVSTPFAMHALISFLFTSAPGAVQAFAATACFK